MVDVLDFLGASTWSNGVDGIVLVTVKRMCPLSKATMCVSTVVVTMHLNKSRRSWRYFFVLYHWHWELISGVAVIDGILPPTPNQVGFLSVSAVQLGLVASTMNVPAFLIP